LRNAVVASVGQHQVKPPNVSVAFRDIPSARDACDLPIKWSIPKQSEAFAWMRLACVDFHSLACKHDRNAGFSGILGHVIVCIPTVVMSWCQRMTAKAQCNACRTDILVLTASRNQGMCVPCFRVAQEKKQRPLRILKGIVTFPRDMFRSARRRLTDWWERKHWPQTVEETVKRLQARADGSWLNQYKSRDEFVTESHFFLGMYIRNKFGSWQGNQALLDDCGVDDDFVQADAASAVILESYWDAEHRHS